MKSYQEMIAERPRKFASFLNCGSYKCRMTPFFDTVAEVEMWAKKNVGDIDNCYIRPVANWQEVTDNRNEYNTDNIVPIGQ